MPRVSVERSRRCIASYTGKCLVSHAFQYLLFTSHFNAFSLFEQPSSKIKNSIIKDNCFFVSFMENVSDLNIHRERQSYPYSVQGRSRTGADEPSYNFLLLLKCTVLEFKVKYFRAYHAIRILFPVLKSSFNKCCFVLWLELRMSAVLIKSNWEANR